MLDLGLVHFDKFSLPTEIIGQKITLRQRTHAHDEALFQMIERSRAHLRRFLFWVDDTKTLADVRQVTDIFLENWEKQLSFEYVVLERTHNRLIGAGGIHTISHMNRMAEYGYYLDQAATGQGYASEMVALLEKELFQNGIHRLVIECDAENKASAKVAERNGFVYEGRLHDAKWAYGAYRDELVYAKLNPHG